MRPPGSLIGAGRSTIALSALNTAALTPMPSASVNIAPAVKPSAKTNAPAAASVSESDAMTTKQHTALAAADPNGGRSRERNTYRRQHDALLDYQPASLLPEE